jgi:uncharacterized protein (DUF1501 family)
MSLSRRDFIKATLAASTVVSFAPSTGDLLVPSCAAAKDNNADKVLVVVQLSGGNDGLNTLVPYGDDEYHRNRPTIALPQKQLHKIDSMFGFHPRMEAFAELYKQGHLGVIQGVGYPNTSQDHEVAMRTWHTADCDNPNRQTGWLGRTADSVCGKTRTNTPVVFVSSIRQPFALNAENAIIPSVTSLEDLTIHQPSKLASETLINKNPFLGLVRENTESSHNITRRVVAASKAAGSSGYPKFTLAENLRTIARLIRADVGIRVYFTELGGDGFGGFDNHANQIGNHCALLGQLSESVAAFVNDLKADNLLDNVLLMTFSEFGRTVAENGRRGTDHGAAAPVFVVGGRLKGGLTGAHPDMSDLTNGAQKFHTDFRRLYATVLDEWLGFDSKSVLGKRFDTVDFLNM